MRLSALGSAATWPAGLAIAALLAFVIRPVLGGLVSLPVRLTRRERVFFLWTGLKGAVPILLGMTIAASGTPGAARAYQVIFVIVGFSVTVQGGLVPTLAHRLGIPLRTVEPEPWSLGVRFSEEPEGLHRYHVAAGLRRRRQRRQRPALRRERLGQPHRQGRQPGHGRGRHRPCGPATTFSSSPNPTRPRPSTACSRRPGRPTADGVVSCGRGDLNPHGVATNRT